MGARGPRGPHATDRPRLTVRGWGVTLAGIVFALAALILGNRDLLTVACLLVGLPLVALMVVRRGRAELEVSRNFVPDVVAVGDPTQVTVTVTNLAGRPVAASRCRDGDEGEWSGGSLPFPALARASGRGLGRVRGVIRYTVTPRQRGIHEVGPLIVHSGDGLGLVTWERSYPGVQRLAVIPRVEDLSGDGANLGGSDGAIDRARLSLAGGTDDTLPREYRPGDPMRRVHWRSTARHGDLMVRQDEEQSDPQCWVILDNRMSSHPDFERSGGRSSRRVVSAGFEWSVRLAASIAVHAQREGYRARLVATADPTVLDAAANDRGGTQSAHDALLEFASMNLLGGLTHGDYAHELEQVMRASGGSRPVFAVFGSIDEDEASRLARLGVLGRPATIFVMRSAPGVEQTLTRAGWRYITVSETDDIATVWQDVTARSGHVVH